MTVFDLPRLIRWTYFALYPLAGWMAGYLTAALIGVMLQSEPLVEGGRPVVVVAEQGAPADYRIIAGRNLFDPDARSRQTLTASEPVPDTPAVSSSRVNFTLLGTIVAGEDSLAVLQGGNEIASYRLGSEVPGGGKVTAIERKTVTLTFAGGAAQILTLDEGSTPVQAGGAVPVSPGEVAGADGGEDSDPVPDAASGIRQIAENSYSIPRETADRSRQNLSELLKTARMTPNVVEGETDGFRVAWVKKGSFLEMLGIRKGDLLREVNGTALDGPEKALQIFQQLREANKITLGIERGGQRISYEYDIE